MKKLILAITIAFVLNLASPALAQDSASECRTTFKTQGANFGTILKRVGCMAGFISPTDTGAIDSATEAGFAFIVGRIVGYLLAFAGVVFIILIVYGGWLWMSAQGNEEQVGNAQKQIRNAVIGIIVVFSAFVITWAVLEAVTLGLGEPPAS